MIVIIGSGLSGLICAYMLYPLPVLIITPANLSYNTSSSLAQGGMASPVLCYDGFNLQIKDTFFIGLGISNFKIIRDIIFGNERILKLLLKSGLIIDKRKKICLCKEGGYSSSRIIHSGGDLSGENFILSLVKSVRFISRIKLLEGYVVINILSDNNVVKGVWVSNVNDGSIYTIVCDIIVIASGGLGHLYSETTNPKTICGTGIGLAAETGALICNPEFIQFHPTALSINNKFVLITEAIRGIGAYLINNKGKRFMKDINKKAELASRDIVSLSVFNQIKSGNSVFIDCRHVKDKLFSFPTFIKNCNILNLNPFNDLIPISPAVHYHIGGIYSDINGKTTVENLWAIGESSYTGFHGSNRLASNSILEALVTGIICSESIKKSIILIKDFNKNFIILNNFKKIFISWSLGQDMMNKAGILRNESELIEFIKKLKLFNKNCLIKTAALITIGALLRKETRGSHNRIDYPLTNLFYNKNTNLYWKDVEYIMRYI